MSRPWSLTARLSLAFAGVATCVFAGLGVFITSDIDRHFEMLDRDVLQGKVLLIQSLAAHQPAQGGLEMLTSEIKAAFVGHGDMAMVAYSLDGRLLFATTPLQIPASYLDKMSGRDAPTMFEWILNGHRYRAMTDRIKPASTALGPMRVFVSIPLAHHAQFVSLFGRTLAVVTMIAAALTGLLGWLVVRNGLAPLRLLRSRASEITAARLDDRLPVNAVPHELAGLTDELNQMLARLEDAFKRLSEFSSDIAHELRTPISNLMTQTHVVLSQPRDALAYREVLESNAEEYERLARMVSDMLFLARAEHGLMLPSVESVALHDELRALFDYYDALAEARHVSLRCSGDGTVQGDRLMLRRALSNLLSNAVRHASAHSELVVTIEANEQDVSVAIENAGETIAEADLAQVFERFYRADRARAHAYADGEAMGEGAGLGLAITRAIVLAHGGVVVAESNQGITRFMLRLPVAGVTSEARRLAMKSH